MRRILLLLLTLSLCILPEQSQASRMEMRERILSPLFDAPCTKYGIPKVLALAIARQESECHPWIINIQGKDFHARSFQEAVSTAEKAMSQGKSFDVGIMQVNSYWIRKYGWPIESVLHPRNNVMIGCWILAQEIRRHGMTWQAIAYYHTPLHRNYTRGVNYARKIIRHVHEILNTRPQD